LLIGRALPPLYAVFMHILPAGNAVCDILSDWVESLIADATVFTIGVRSQSFAVFLQLGLEKG
jgi:hypothetical protein